MSFHNPLLDKDFLKELSIKRERETYARIIALTFQEEPIELIEGKVSSGSINIDGTSAVRRTCSLSLIANELNINDFYWGLKSKFKLEIGIKNTINSNYPEIIWFPQGIFLITAFNTNQSINNYTISISGKDKMCLLNGEIGGSLTASIDFGIEEYYDKENNVTTYTPVPIKKIIREAVHTYAGEPYYNIIINDLDMMGLELLEYRGDTEMFLLRDVKLDQFINYTFNKDQKCVLITDLNTIISFKDLTEEQLDNRIEIDETSNPAKIYLIIGEEIIGEEEYTVAKLSLGQTAGYRATDLIYAGDLISNIGESLTSILDKIKSMLGEYEYFYDLDGRFVFQKKRNYISTTWNPIKDTGDDIYVEPDTSAISYSFIGNNLITSFQNTPNLTNLRNDYSIWGERTLVSGAKLPIHYRYAIDKKPEKYTSVNITENDIKGHNSKNPNNPMKIQVSKTYSIEEYDWREIIYQMALDYYAYNQLDDFIYKIAEANKADNLYIDGITGYEQYYIDLQGFWRDLYNPIPSEEEIEYYNSETYWANVISTDPSSLNFWFDFLDTTGELNQFSIPVIGDRPKSVNDKNITSIYFREVPNLIFTNYIDFVKDNLDEMTGYTPVLMQGNMESLFSVSAQGKSAKDKLDELLYNHSYCIENISISAIPIYHLQPNTRIYVYDDKSKIDGEYIISRITLPLAYNGTMSITATKAPERIN